MVTNRIWGTAANVTTNDMRVGPTGNLVNFLTGQTLPVTMTATPTGSPDDFGTMVYPYGGTPASNMFCGVVDLSNQNSGIGVRLSAGTAVSLTFSNLNPEKHYVFRGTAVRGNYALRWTVATITGADTFIDAHINGNGRPGVLTSNDYPANLAPGQAAWNSGDNRQGAIIGWDFISPGADGSFSIICTQYVGQIPGGNSDSGNYGYAICGMLLAEVEAAPPSVTANPAPTTTVEQNRPFSLSVTAEGSPLLYQWYKEGEGPIAGATFATYAVPHAALTNSGDYYAVVYNPLARATSALAHVIVNQDVTPPGVVTAFCYPSFDPASQTATIDQVIVEYSEPVDSASATEVANYALPNDNGASSITMPNDRTVILKLASPLAEDTDSMVTVSGVTDISGNSIASGGTNNPAPFRTWMRSPGNGLLYEAFATDTAADVPALTNNPAYPNNPFFRTNLWAFDSRIAFPDDTHDGYGSRTRGVFIAPVSGDWVFFLRSDARSTVYFNTNGPIASGLQQLVAETTGANGDWNKLLSSPVSLRAGQAYYIEGLQKEDTGIDYIKVAARLAGTGLPPLGIANTVIDSNALTGSAIGFPLAPRDLGGPITLAHDLVNVTNQENEFVLFDVGASNPSGLPMFYQWFRNDAPIPGATGPTYTFRVAQADSTAKFKVQVSKIGSTLTSHEATLTVTADLTRPRVFAVHGSLQSDKVIVSFTEPIPAPDVASFEMAGGIGVTFAALDSTGTNVVLTLDTPLAVGSTNDLTVTDVYDLVGLPVDPNPTVVPVRAWVMSRGFAMEQLFTNLGTGTAVTNLTGNAKYPNSPDQINWKATLEGPINFADAYGTRLIGWIQPPLDGEYRFYMCSDDNGSFRLSPDNLLVDATEIAKEISYAGTRTWTGTNSNNDRGIPPCNVSTNPVSMVAGNLYAFEALAKEGSGSDNLGVNWMLPGGTPPANGTPGLPGAYLYSLADPVGASVTITQQPQSVATSALPATVTFRVGATATLRGAPYANLSYLWQKDSGGGFQDVLGAYGSSLAVSLTPTNNGTLFRCLVFSPGASAISDAATVGSGGGPRLSVAREPTRFVLSWPLASAQAGFQLVQAQTLPPVQWTVVPSSLYVTNGQTVSIEVALPSADPRQFYRLRQP